MLRATETHTPYNSYQYLWPPRPRNKIKPSNLKKYEGSKWILQPKLDGSCAVIFTDGKRVIVQSRHNRGFTRFKMNDSELLSLHKGTPNTWMVLVGEYMNKSRKDELGNVWNQKLVIFDILVYDGELLIGETMSNRIQLLEELFPERAFKPHLSKITKNIWRVNSITDTSGYMDKFERIKRVDMFEGFVLKKADAVLKPPLRQTDNSKSQLKVRKPTRNYRY